MLPIGRWKGYGGDTDLHGDDARDHHLGDAACSPRPQRITVFGTVHAPLFHPIIAAKQIVTADHVGEGRFGLNIVAGWNEGEFEMFGVQQRDHETRYAYAQEWIDAVKLAWGPQDDFDFDGEFIKLKKVRAKPKPYGGTRPLIMNAGSSGTGQAFALRNCDAFFTATSTSRQGVDATREDGAGGQEPRRARIGREIEVFTVGQVICRPTQKEAEDYYQLRHHREWPTGARSTACWRSRTSRRRRSARRYSPRSGTYFASRAIGGYPFVGTPDHVAEELADLSRAGVRGIAFSFVNYLDELPFFRDEVLPRLERMGVRAKN